MTGFFAFPLIAALAVTNSVAVDCNDLAAYRAGRDVYGRPVVGADLNGGYGIAAPESFSLPVAVLLKQAYPKWQSDTFFGALPVARVEVHDGQVFLNGKLVAADDVDTINAACDSVKK